MATDTQSFKNEIAKMEFADDFPMEDRQILERQLQDWDILIPGFSPSEPGLLSLEAQCLAEIEGINIIILADRNIVTRWAAIAKDGVTCPMDLPTQQAAYLMAFAQTANWDVEPGLSFHELASSKGNEGAHQELSLFRAADRPQRSGWINIALGREKSLPDAILTTEIHTNLEFPLDRWRMNYVTALKIAELELSTMTALERMLELLRWMKDDFIFAASAALFAVMYFSPSAKKKSVIKQLRGSCRNKALAGVKNAAWDITYLGEFVRLVTEPVDNQKQYVFATADKKLAI